MIFQWCFYIIYYGLLAFILFGICRLLGNIDDFSFESLFNQYFKTGYWGMPAQFHEYAVAFLVLSVCFYITSNITLLVALFMINKFVKQHYLSKSNQLNNRIILMHLIQYLL